MAYMHVYCKYMHAYPAMTPTKRELIPPPQITVPLDTIKRAQLRALLGIWQVGLFVIGNIFADQILGTTPLSTPPGPLLHPSGSAGKPPMP